MAIGGKREGAGRKAGSMTKRTREIAEQAAQRNITPLEVMIENMEFARDQALEARKKADTETEASYRSLAQTAAKDAAPYIHPRLANIEMKSDVKLGFDTKTDRETIEQFLKGK